MKKLKRIFAIIGCLLLVSLYIITLFAAVFDYSNTMVLFKACIYSTIVIPTSIFAYTFIYKLLKKYYGKENQK